MRKAKKRKAAPKKKAAAKKKVVRKVRKGAKAWTKADVVLLRKLYKTTSTTQIARKLKRSVASVQAKAQTLGLKKAVRKKVAKKKVVAKRKPARRKVARKKPAKKKVAKKKVAKRKPAKRKVAKKKTAKRKPARRKVAKNRVSREQLMMTARHFGGPLFYDRPLDIGCRLPHIPARLLISEGKTVVWI